MLRRITSWLNERPLRRARAARERAYEAVRDAEARNDTRDLGRARMNLLAATTALLGVEARR